MAKAKSKKAPVEKGLSIKVKLDKGPEHGKERLRVTVSLLQDGVEISSDYDFVNIEE